MPDQPAPRRRPAPEALQKASESARLLALAARLAWRASPKIALGTLLLYGAQAALPPLELFLTRAVLDRAALDLGLTPSPGVQAGQAQALVTSHSLATWIALAAAALACGRLLSTLAAALQELAGDRITGYVTEHIIRATNRWPGLARFEDPTFADHLQRARTEANQAGTRIIPASAASVINLIGLCGLAGLLAGLHPLAPVLLAAAALPQIAAHFTYRSRIGSRMYGQTPEARRLQYAREVLLTPEPAKDVRLYDLAGLFRAYYDATFVPMQAERNAERARLGGVVAGSALAAFGLAAVYLSVVWLVLTGQRTLGELALYGGAATLFQLNLFRLNAAIGDLPLDLHFLPSLFCVLDAPADLPLPPQDTARRAPRAMRHGITFECVGFAYPGSAPILHDVSCTLHPGQCVALVGHNGAGKTTLVKLLLRFYDPTAGRITLDGTDLRDYDLADLRRRMGVVFQDFARFELTAGENVALGRVDDLMFAAADPHATPAQRTEFEKTLRDAAVRAGASELLDSLPKGIETQLGRQLGGRDLSGGEWQKLALARAFVRDCDLLILDEPTAALDVRAEYELYLRFHELTRGKTTVLISHRLSTVRMADRILYLADGRIQEDGSHADLLAAGGEYARLYRLQADQYLTTAEKSHPVAASAGAPA